MSPVPVEISLTTANGASPSFAIAEAFPKNCALRRSQLLCCQCRERESSAWCRPTLFQWQWSSGMVAKTNVSSRQGQKKGWQAAPLFQRGGEPPLGAEQDGATHG